MQKLVIRLKVDYWTPDHVTDRCTCPCVCEAGEGAGSGSGSPRCSKEGATGTVGRRERVEVPENHNIQLKQGKEVRKDEKI